MNIKMLKAALAGLALSVSGFANASLIILDFEGIGNTANINDFYNGGTDSQGNSGVNYGISFGTNTLGLIDSDAGGTASIANEPSGESVMFFSTGSAILNYAAGFDTGFSFFYSSAKSATVDIFDGINGTGNILGSIDLAAQNTDNCIGDPNGNYCNWTNIGASFAGTAKSINFGGSANFIAFDDVTFGSEVAGEATDVPEPSTLAIFALGIMGLASRRFKKQS
jgi:hypothetical protein